MDEKVMVLEKQCSVAYIIFEAALKHDLEISFNACEYRNDLMRVRVTDWNRRLRKDHLMYKHEWNERNVCLVLSDLINSFKEDQND